MYSHLLFFHSLTRWLVLASLLFAIYRALVRYYQYKPFLKGDNAVRHWTATIAHIQLIIGVILYIKSPVAQLFWRSGGSQYPDAVFFGLAHFSLMIVSVVLVTIGSAMAKRKATDSEKFKTMLIWFSLTLLLIFIAIPWPFSPLANRPYFRTF